MDWPTLSDLPFMAGAVGPKMSAQRFIEALVIAAVTAGITTWSTVKVLDAKLAYLDTKQKNMEERLQKVEYTQNMAIGERGAILKEHDRRLDVLEHKK